MLHYVVDSIKNGPAANSIHARAMSIAYAEINDNIKTHFLGKKYAFRSLSLLGRIYRCLKIFWLHPDVVNFHTRSRIFWVIALLYGKKVVYEYHDIPKWIRLENLLISSRSTIGLIFITEALKSDMSVLLPSLFHKKSLVLPDGAFLTERDFNWPSIDSEYYNVGYAGQLYKGKGMEMIVKIGARLDDRFRIYVIGGFPEDVKYWREIIRIKGLDNRIQLLGLVDHKQVSGFLKRMDCLVLPNQPKVSVYGGNGDIGKYTSPLKLFEYMNAGKPIIASDLEVLKEVLSHGRNAILCPFDDVDAWCSAIELCHGDIRYSKELSEAAITDLSEKYTWNIRAKSIINEFFS